MGKRTGRTAAELIAELEADPEHQARKREREAAMNDEHAVLEEAEKPVLADLAAIGVDTDSPWNLYRDPEARARAVPVLLDHIERDYPDKVVHGIGQALTDRSARGSWDRIKEIYLATRSDLVRDQLSHVLGHVAVREHYDDLLAFLADESLGITRTSFIRAVNRIGNRMESGKGRQVIEGLVDDPELSAEARAVLAGRSRKD